MLAALFWKLRVEMSKKCTRLWHEAHFALKSVKTDGFESLFGIKMSFCVVHLARSEQNVRVAAVSTITTLHCITLITLHYTSLHYTKYNYTRLH